MVWTALCAAIAAGSPDAIDTLDEAARERFGEAARERFGEAARERFVGAPAVNLTLNAGWTWCLLAAASQAQSEVIRPA